MHTADEPDRATSGEPYRLMALEAAELLGLVLLVLVMLLMAVAVRRLVLRRGGGAIELSLQLRGTTPGRGWVLGVGRFEGDELRWYRVFSLASRPRRTLRREELVVRGRRAPTGVEKLSLLAGAVVLECTADRGEVSLAMGESALTGFLAWLESAPPGSARRR